MIHRCASGASEHNPCCVVGAIDEASAGPLDGFDAGGVHFYFARGRASVSDGVCKWPYWHLSNAPTAASS